MCYQYLRQKKAIYIEYEREVVMDATRENQRPLTPQGARVGREDPIRS